MKNLQILRAVNEEKLESLVYLVEKTSWPISKRTNQKIGRIEKTKVLNKRLHD